MRRGLFVVAVVAAGSVTACGSAQVGRTATAADGESPTPGVQPYTPSPTPVATSVVPWADDPVAIPSPTPSPLPSGVPLCSADQLDGRPGQHGVGLGSYHLQLTFSARPGVRCALRYGPLVVGVRADGSTRTISKPNTKGWANPIAIVTPGVAASLDVSAGESCDAILAGQHDTFVTLRVTIPGGGVIDVDVPDGFDDECGGGADYFTSSAPEQIPTPSPLTATMSAPSSVHAGDELNYTVTLTNPTDHKVSLEPCPTYTESVATFGGSNKTTVTQLRYRLNCATLREIPPQASAAFEMRLAVPGDQLPGGAKFVWHLDTESSTPGAFSPLTIVSG